MIDTLQTQPWAFVFAVGVLGLLAGSFLNVVIHRLPLMMEREWRAQCVELLAIEGEPARERLGLVLPRSHCPRCGYTLSALENIPVLSYLVLRGKCSACGGRISLRYPSVEILTAMLSTLVAWHFGLGWTAMAALFLTWALIALCFIDLDHQLLPDSITLPFLWLGLALSLFDMFANSRTAILGALGGYLSLWSIYILFKWITGKEGMGSGDFKLLAMLGAWMGWQSLPVVILMSSLVGALVGITLVLARGRDKHLPLPFGPYLATAGWITLLWGKDITDAYWAYTGIAS